MRRLFDLAAEFINALGWVAAIASGISIGAFLLAGICSLFN